MIEQGVFNRGLVFIGFQVLFCYIACVIMLMHINNLSLRHYLMPGGLQQGDDAIAKKAVHFNVNLRLIKIYIDGIAVTGSKICGDKLINIFRLPYIFRR